MTPENVSLCTEIAERLVRSYRRQAGNIEAAEIRQEAWTAMLTALPSYTGPVEGVEGYLYVSARRAVKLLIWRLSVPANVPARSATPEVVRTLRNGRVSEEALACVPAAGVGPEALVADREAKARLAQLVAELLASDREAEAVTAVLWGSMESAQAAEAYSIPVAEIYAATREAKRKLARCPRLMEVL